MVTIAVLNENGVDLFKWTKKYDSTKIEDYLMRKYSYIDHDAIMWQAFPDEVPIKVIG